MSKSHNVFYLGLASFFNDVSTEMIMPILPMFIIALGGNSLIIGLIGGLRESVVSILNIFIGYWSDKTGRRLIFVFLGYLISSICKFFLAITQQWPLAFFFVSLERAGKGFRKTPVDTLIAESAPDHRGMSFGIHRTLDTLGAILGSLLSLMFLVTLHVDLHTIILVASVIGLLALIPLFKVMPVATNTYDRPLFSILKTIPVKLKMFLVASGLFAFANFSYMFFLMKVSVVASVGVSTAFYFVFNSFYAAGAIPLGMLTDRIGLSRVIMFGYLLFSGVSCAFMYASSIKAFLILFPLYGIVYALVEGNQRAYVATLVSSDLDKSSLMGLFHTVVGISALVGNLVAGALWQFISPQAAFLFGGVVSFIAVMVWFNLGRVSRQAF
jgi:Arabinose efflux permease